MQILNFVARRLQSISAKWHKLEAGVHRIPRALAHISFKWKNPEFDLVVFATIFPVHSDSTWRKYTEKYTEAELSYGMGIPFLGSKLFD